MGKAGVSYPVTKEDDFNPAFRLSEDGHGIDELLSWVNLLPVGIGSSQRECQRFLLR